MSGAEQQCVRLRSLVQDCLAKHMYDSAAFFADKLVTLSQRAPADIYLLAQAYFMGGQHRRCLALLKGSGLLENTRVRFLAAKCLAAGADWEDCLTMLGGWDAPEHSAAEIQELRGLAEAGAQELSYYAATCLLRGHAFDALENHARALRCYRTALRADPLCYEAFQALIERHMLTAEEEQDLLAELSFPPEERWLQLLYRCTAKKYGQQDTIEGDLEELESPLLSEAETGAGGTHRAGFLETPAQRAGRHGAQAAPPSPPESADEMEISPEKRGGRPQRRPVDGCGLGDNLAVKAARAEWLYHMGRYQECYDLTEALLERDPYALECLPAHLASALELKKKNQLFLQGHRLVNEYPGRAVAWFAVGCYYMCTRQYDSARRYFGKATSLDPKFAPAWIGFGNAFAAQDESDQAMAAYRTAARQFPGLHVPLVGMGMEYQRMNNLALAEQMFMQAHSICPGDPLLCNELGVLAYRNQQYADAEAWLQRAQEAAPAGGSAAAWEPTLVNMAHVLRKSRRYEEAVEQYHAALVLAPGEAGTFAALGFTYHLQGGKENTDLAVEHYHKALSLRPEDTLAAEMLSLALEEDCQYFTAARLQSDDF